ncbi:type II toxin-antitoxin system VapB family antitoxin [Candidatus Acetothermia bacterium]|nr:type II toxin-antitoxin system VapB family antitoxin [Candidatus Acetothermia bacterium]
MRTTLNLDDELLAQAREYTGIQEKTRLVHLGLEALIQREAARRLAALGGSDRAASGAPRRRSSFNKRCRP